jgi:hypothetical protein
MPECLTFAQYTSHKQLGGYLISQFCRKHRQGESSGLRASLIYLPGIVSRCILQPRRAPLSWGAVTVKVNSGVNWRLVASFEVILSRKDCVVGFLKTSGYQCPLSRSSLNLDTNEANACQSAESKLHTESPLWDTAISTML